MFLTYFFSDFGYLLRLSPFEAFTVIRIPMITTGTEVNGNCSGFVGEEVCAKQIYDGLVVTCHHLSDAHHFVSNRRNSYQVIVIAK